MAPWACRAKANEEKMKINIAQIKILPEKGQLEENHRRLMAALPEVAKRHPDVTISSECYLDGYIVTEDEVSREDLRDYAVDPEHSQYVGDVTDWARRNNSWFIHGCMRRADGGVYNTAMIIDRKGRLRAFYDKTHCLNQDRKFIRGESIPVFESDFGKFGVLICADRRWPESVRTIALKGARVIFNPTYGMHNELNLCMMCTRSYESIIYIAFTHPLQALITSPHGTVVSNVEAEDISFTVTEIDLQEVDARRETSGHLSERRSDLYQL